MFTPSPNLNSGVLINSIIQKLLKRVDHTMIYIKFIINRCVMKRKRVKNKIKVKKLKSSVKIFTIL